MERTKIRFHKVSIIYIPGHPVFNDLNLATKTSDKLVDMCYRDLQVVDPDAAKYNRRKPFHALHVL